MTLTLPLFLDSYNSIHRVENKAQVIIVAHCTRADERERERDAAKEEEVRQGMEADWGIRVIAIPQLVSHNPIQ